MIKYLVFISIFIFLNLSCKKKTEEVKPTEEDYWKPFNEIKYFNKNSSYCHSDGKILYIRSLDSYSVFDSNHVLIRSESNSTNINYRYTAFPLVNNQFINIYDPSYIDHKSIIGSSSPEGINLDKDTSIVSIRNPAFFNYWDYPFIGSPSGYCVFKVSNSKNKNVNGDYANLVVIDLNRNKYIKRIELPILGKIALHYYEKGKFYFSNYYYDNSLYTLDSAGNYEKLANQGFLRLIKVNDLMIGIDGGLYISFDQGITWNKSTINSPSLQVLSLDGKAIFYTWDNIGEIKIEGKLVKIIGYNKKGLEGNTITYLCKHRERYYCTTQSGVFYIEEKYFKPTE